jgi:hypothetical protein
MVSFRTVRPRKLGKKPHARAFWSVERAGENRAASANATSSVGVADGMAAKMEFARYGGAAGNDDATGTEDGEGNGGRSTLMCQRPVASV